MKKIYPFIALLFVMAVSVNAQTTWDNFEDSRKGEYFFINGSFIPYFENPSPNGVNDSRVVASYTRNAAEAFDVIVIDAAMADLSSYLNGTKEISIDVWSPAVGKTVQVTLENNVLAEPANFPTGRHSVYLATTTVANAWETLTFSFDNQPDASIANDNVNRLVLLFDPNTNNGDTYYWDNLNAPELSNDPCDGSSPNAAVFNDFECNQNVDFTFSHAGVNFRRVANPDQTGNTSDFVATYTRNGGEETDVIIGFFDGNLALQDNSTISLDVWDPNAPTTVIVSLQNENNDVILEMTAETSMSSSWETLTYDPSSVAAATDIAKFVILFDPGEFSSDNYYFDNFGFGTPTAVEDLEQLTQFEVAPNPTTDLATFTYELTETANIQVAIYDNTGKQVASLLNETQPAGSHQTTWQANGLANGLYFYTVSIDGATASGKIILAK